MSFLAVNSGAGNCNIVVLVGYVKMVSKTVLRSPLTIVFSKVFKICLVIVPTGK